MRRLAAWIGALTLLASGAAHGVAAAAGADPLFHSSYLTIRQGVDPEGPNPFAIGDVNNDGVLDLVMTGGSYLGPVVIRFGDGYGNFGPAVFQNGPQMLSHGVWSVKLADLNRDGRLDMVFSSRADTSVYTQLGHGDGTFDPPVISRVGCLAQAVCIGDMNEDGIPDLVAASRYGGGGFSILCGDGTGHFTQTYRSFNTYNFTQAALADMDGDGHLDLVGPDGWIFLGDGHGLLPGIMQYGMGLDGLALAVADLDHDGANDILTESHYGTGLTVHIGPPMGQNGSPRDTSYEIGRNLRSIVVQDLDGDGRPEVIVGSSDVRVFTADATGRLGLRQVLPSPSETEFLTASASDLNGDGYPDIVACGGVASAVYYGGPGGAFPVLPSYTLHGRPSVIASGNFTDAGHKSIAVFLTNNGAIEVVRAGPDGTITPESHVGVGSGIRAMVSANLDGDGRDELVVADSLSSTIAVLKSLPSGVWQRTDYPAVSNMHWLAVADVNQDGYADIATEDRGTGTLHVLAGSAAGFGPPQVAAQGLGAYDMARFSDFNGDADPDLALVSHSGGLGIFAGAPGIGFVYRTSANANDNSVSGMTIGDFNSNSLQDVITCGSSGYEIAKDPANWGYSSSVGNWYLNDYMTGHDLTDCIQSGDLHADGLSDLVLSNRGRPFASLIRVLPQLDFEEAVWGYGFGSTDLDQVLLADVTGDGLSDLIATEPAANRLWVAPHVPAASTAVPTAPGAAPGAHVAFDSSTPNPTRGAATLRFVQFAPGQVRLAILDVRGRIVRRFAERAAAGSLSVAWDGRDDAGARVGAGIYFARLTQLAPGQVVDGAMSTAATGKLVVLP